MSNKRKSFLLHIDSLDILDDLTDSESGELFKAIKDYHCGVTPELSGLVRIAFSPFRNQFARDAEKYSLTCERRAEAGSIGGRANKRDPGVDNKGETQLYVLRLYNENEDFIKIGTTTNRINRRFSGVKNMPYEYEIIHQLIGEDVELESLLQSALSEFLYDPSIRFPGHNECFTRECLNKLKQIQPFAQAKCSKIGQKIANLADSDSKNDSDSKSDSKNNNDLNNTSVSRFSEFWDLYGKKVDTKKCEAKFNKLTKTEVDALFSKLPDYIRSTPDKQYRKNPVTWLNGKCWNDEIQLPLTNNQQGKASALHNLSNKDYSQHEGAL